MKYVTTSLFFAFSLATLLFVPGAALAQEHTQIYCSACRDPNVHPADFGNAAFNALKTPNNGFTFDDLDAVEVINRAGQWAWVNIDFEMLAINMGFRVPTFFIPTGNLIIQVTSPSGHTTSYVVDLEIPNQLTVGTGNGPGYDPAGGDSAAGNNPPANGSSSGGGSGGYYEDWGDFWDGWENGYGGQMPWYCAPDFSDPHNTTIICFR